MYKIFLFWHYIVYSSPCNTSEVAFGVETGKIADSQLSSSSAYPGLEAIRGRLKGAASWSTDVLNKNQWFQIDLGRDEVVTAIATQGRANADQWVKSYSVSYSLVQMRKTFFNWLMRLVDWFHWHFCIVVRLRVLTSLSRIWKNQPFAPTWF